MKQTLLVIPHEFLANWALPLWIVAIVLLIVVQSMRFGWSRETSGLIWIGGIGALLIRFVLPNVEIWGYSPDPPHDPAPLGLAIRGYGAMFLAALVFGVGLVLLRAKQMGVDGDVILSLAFWVFLAGIVGARAFYVIEYWDQFQAGTVTERLGRMINTTTGGLVVYGSFIGAVIAVAIFSRTTRLPILATADLVMPGMLLGLALGRVGCFLNGCCYGGECDWPIAVRFPRTGGAYVDQLETGRLVGLTGRVVEREPFEIREVTAVEPESPAARAGFREGDRYLRTPLDGDAFERAELGIGPEGSHRFRIVAEDRSKQVDVPLLELPERSLPVHPTQLYATVGALLLCAALWFAYPFRYGDGEIFGWGVAAYSIVRFFEEQIRVDESGQFGTELSISQWTGLLLLPLGIALIARARLGSGRRAFPPAGLAADAPLDSAVRR